MAEKMVEVVVAEGAVVKHVVQKGPNVISEYAAAGDVVLIPERFYTERIGKLKGAPKPVEPEEGDSEAAREPYEEMTVVQLRALLSEKEMDTAGNKAVLIERLMEAGVAPEGG